jgi:hypothetical protein
MIYVINGLPLILIQGMKKVVLEGKTKNGKMKV